MTEGKLKIRQQLQRSFSVLKKCLQTWKESQNETASAKDKIGNFTEQYQCCAKVDAGSLDICRQFPDLQERLLFKIECEANEIFAELQNHIDVMKDCCDKITRQYDNCLKTYKKFSTAEDLASICERTATRPSVADMLEWLQVSETLLRQQYLCKQELMRMFRMSDEATTEVFMKEWEIGEKEMLKQIEGYLCFTSFFIEEKI